MIQLPQDVHPLAQIGNSLAPFANMLGNLYQQRQQLAMNLEAQQAQRNALQQAYQQNQGQGAQQLFSGLLSAPGGQELAESILRQSPNLARHFNLSFGPSGVAGSPQQSAQQGVPPVNAVAQRADATQQELGVMQPQAQQQQPIAQRRIPEKRGVGSKVDLSTENYPEKPPVSIDLPTPEDWHIDPVGSRIRYETSIMEANKYTEELKRKTAEKAAQTQDIEFDAAQLAKKFPEMASGKFQNVFEEFVASSQEKYKNMSPHERAANIEKDLRSMQTLQDNLSKSAIAATGVGPFPTTFDVQDKYLPKLIEDTKPFREKGMQKYGEMILASEGIPPTLTSYLLDPLDKTSQQIINSIPVAKTPKYGITEKKRASMLETPTEEEYEKFDKTNPKLKSQSIPLIRRALEAGELPFTIREELIRKHKIPSKIAGRYIKEAGEDIVEDMTDLQQGQYSRVDFSNSEINSDMLRGAKGLRDFLGRFLQRLGSE